MTSGATLLSWRDMRVDWTAVPGGSSFGSIRGVYTQLQGKGIGARLVVLPFGQSSPPHSFNEERIIVQLEGETEFEIAGIPYRLGRYDMLLIPADTVFGYTNVGRGDVFFVAFIATPEAATL